MFLVGLLNTLLVSVVGIFFATVIGFLVALGRLSPNWLLSRIAGGYVELIRNLPLLFQILFWYLAVLAALPNPRQSISLFGSFFLSNRGFVIPKPIGDAAASSRSWSPLVIAIVASLAAAALCAPGSCSSSGRMIRIWPYVLGLLIGLPLLTVLVFGAPVTFEIPELKGFNFAGGSRVIPEFVALTLALSTYTAAFIAEIVRAGILSVHKGQMEAGSSLGLQRGSTLRLIVVPQAMRVILPPLTNQYLNLTKNSSLAVAIGYPDLVSVFAGTTLSQTGQAIEIIAITMGVYLLISLVTSAIMSFYGWRLGRSLRRMSDIARVRLRPPGPRSRARRADQDHRLRRLPAHAAVQFADQYPAHHRRRPAAVVHRRSRGQIPADRCGLDRQGPHRVPCRECRTTRSAPAGRSSRPNSASSSTASIPRPSAGGST